MYLKLIIISFLVQLLMHSIITAYKQSTIRLSSNCVMHWQRCFIFLFYMFSLCTEQNSQTSVEQVRVEDCILEEEKLIKQQEELRGEVVDLTRLAQIKADEREQKSRDYMRAEVLTS